jgi:hypothetical protein
MMEKEKWESVGEENIQATNIVNILVHNIWKEIKNKQ